MKEESSRTVGTRMEERAAAYLKSIGYEILEQNFRCRSGEIDLIAREDGYLCFIEVKYRSSLKSGTPFHAVDLRKQRRISSTALFYLMMHQFPEDTPCRFDVAGITEKDVQLLKNAFEFVG